MSILKPAHVKTDSVDFKINSIDFKTKNIDFKMLVLDFKIDINWQMIVGKSHHYFLNKIENSLSKLIYLRFA